MKYVWRFHNWYDRQQEPLRFLLLLVIASPIITVSLWCDTPAKALGTLIYLVAVLGPRIYREHAKVKP